DAPVCDAGSGLDLGLLSSISFCKSRFARSLPSGCHHKKSSRLRSSASMSLVSACALGTDFTTTLSKLAELKTTRLTTPGALPPPKSLVTIAGTRLLIVLRTNTISPRLGVAGPLGAGLGELGALVDALVLVLELVLVELDSAITYRRWLPASRDYR